MHSQQSSLFLICIISFCISSVFVSCNNWSELPDDERFECLFEYVDANYSFDVTKFTAEQLQDYWAIQNGMDTLPLWVSKDVLYIQNQKKLAKNLGLNEIEVIHIPKTKSIIDLEKFKLSVLAQNSKLGPSQANKIQQEIKNHKLDSQEALYIYIELLKILGAHFKAKNQMIAAWTTYLKGVHTIDKLSTKKYSKLRDKLIYEMLTSISKEQDAQPYREILTYLKGRISDEYFQTYEGHMVNSYLNEENLLEATSNHQKLLEDAIILSQNAFEKANAHFNLGYYHAIDKNNKSASRQYKLALVQFNNKCHKLYFSILMYLIDDPTQLQYVDSLLQYRNCSDELQSKISFLIPGYIDIDLISSIRAQKIDIIMESRRNADKLYPGYSTLHLQDYFIGNYIDLMKLFSSKSNISNEEIALIINTCFDTRRRDLLRQELQSSMEGNLEIRASINNILKEVNEFKEYYPDKIDKYEKLFEDFISINEIEKKNEPRNINLSLLQKKLKSHNTQLLNIVKSFDSYHYYLYDGNQFIIGTINAKNIEERGKELYDSILKKDKFETTYLQNIFKKIPLTNDSNLVIISDGIFKSLPLDELFNDHEVIQFSNVIEYIHFDSLIINDCGIYNFSTEETINDKSIKSIPELKYGLQEVQMIEQILIAKNLKIINFEKLNFNKINSQLLHISSHAYSSNKNRLDNFIYHRSHNNPSEKLFGFNIYEKTQLPEVVVLSACETGTGISTYGAGVQTLSRAFLDNDTQTVIKTLWKVNEKASAELMIDMYTNWVTGISLYDALKMAKENFKSHPKYGHPYYWAGFVLEGNPNIKLDLN